MPAIKGSWEAILHDCDPGNKYLLSREITESRFAKDTIPFRSIGDVYYGQDFYGTAVVAKRFDAFVFIDSTTAINELSPASLYNR
jgi:erythromycin esterase-like protein